VDARVPLALPSDCWYARVCLALQYKIGKVTQCRLGPGGVPFAVLHDGKTLRYPDPDTKVGDTLKVDLETMRPSGLLKFEIGCQVYCSGGRNRGRIGELKGRDRHPGMFDIVHIQDAKGEQVRPPSHSVPLPKRVAHTAFLCS
jgi:ribosomal protein S4E